LTTFAPLLKITGDELIRRKFFEIPDFTAGVAQLARAADL
ncbi:MAG: hypothetical protein RL491_1024, partial [Bacteroidota bacterium]